MSPANVVARQTLREAFATLLTASLVGTGKPAQVVYDYKVSDFKGKYSVVVITSGETDRMKQAQVSRVNSLINLEAHLFVLYAGTPTQATNNPTAGANKTILLPNTEDFIIGQVATIEDLYKSERAMVTDLVTNTSITVDNLANSYTAPNVFWWSEKDAENRLDWLEQEFSNVVMDNDTNETWEELFFDGPSQIDPLMIGGKEYLHEVVSLKFRLHSE
jgi:hypothetical protein